MGSDEQAIAPTDTQLREDLADAMRESPRDSGKSIHIRWIALASVRPLILSKWKRRNVTLAVEF